MYQSLKVSKIYDSIRQISNLRIAGVILFYFFDIDERYLHVPLTITDYVFHYYAHNRRSKP